MQELIHPVCQGFPTSSGGWEGGCAGWRGYVAGGEAGEQGQRPVRGFTLFQGPRQAYWFGERVQVAGDRGAGVSTPL